MSEQASGAGQAALPPSPYQIQVSYGAAKSSTASRAALAPTGSARSIRLRPIAPPDVAGRRFDFPPGYNIVTRPRAYEPIGFHELRAFADAYDLLRLVIETRKDQMERQRWRIRPRARKLKRSERGASMPTRRRASSRSSISFISPTA